MGQTLRRPRQAPGSGPGPTAPGAGSGSAGGQHANGEPQYTAEEAVALYRALCAAFAEESFQKLLRRAEALHPQRAQRGHPDQQAFMSQLQGLLLHVYRTVLPREPWCLAPGWEGYAQMTARMASVAEDPKVMALKEQLNGLLGLPRHTTIRPPQDEPVLQAAPDGSGEVPTYASPLLRDSDGDTAHEFWEEDRGGQLRQVPPSS
mmetsp:Transcript_87177/g.260051  ORF Transcript_87177/g.260051 Transcript_87177/m.260051 type:complete len:205 (-) Transcript_87177:79-693(-)